jgi:hypothetical protein
MQMNKVMKINKQIPLLTIYFAAVLISGATTANAQVATGGSYSLDQAVIASGGGESASGGTFKIEGTIGQAVAGITSTNNTFAVKSGFWTSQALAPTAASVTVSGRIITLDGNGLKNARVILTDMQGNARMAISSAFGYYSFSAVEVGQTYIFTVVSKRYEFAPQVLIVFEDVKSLDFAAQSPLIKYPSAEQ